MIRIGSHWVFATEIRIVQVVTQLTDGQRREIYLSPIIIGPDIAVLVEPTATALDLAGEFDPHRVNIHVHVHDKVEILY